MKKLLFPALFSAMISAAGAAFAQAASGTAYEGMAKPWQLNLQPPATPVMEQLVHMHNMLLVLITAISLFVLALIVYIIFRFHHTRNPIPSKTAHNTPLEIAWTIIPVIILVAIAIPSLRLHYFMDRNEKPDMTLKVTGYQWYWHYDYPDNGGFGYDSYIKKDKDLLPGEHRLLAVDNPVVVPVDTSVRVEITGADVIHSWSVPAFGVKRDAVPGRLNETWFKAEKIGTFYGQCSQLCGVGHGFMPIVVKVVSKDDFAAWVKDHAPAPVATATATKKAPAAKAAKPAASGTAVKKAPAASATSAKKTPAAKEAAPSDDTNPKNEEGN